MMETFVGTSVLLGRNLRCCSVAANGPLSVLKKKKPASGRRVAGILIMSILVYHPPPCIAGIIIITTTIIIAESWVILLFKLRSVMKDVIFLRIYFRHFEKQRTARTFFVSGEL